MKNEAGFLRYKEVYAIKFIGDIENRYPHSEIKLPLFHDIQIYKLSFKDDRKNK